MQMNDARQIDAPPAVVWAALLEPAVLKAAVPGCEELSGSPEEGFEAVVVQKVGPVRARFAGKVTLSDRVEGESLTLSGEGKGGAAGFAKGAAQVRLEPSNGGTLLHYAVEAKVGGKLAQLGSRIIDGFARKMADDFFARFAQAVEGPGDTEAEVPEDNAAATDEAAPRKGWFRRVLGSE
ncbi:MAG: SRPBCC family protein [Pararhodobacter sp.]